MVGLTPPLEHETHFPAGDDEDLVVLWLWSDREGVFSHETALVRHELSDLLPHEAEMTVPIAWTRRRLRVPRGLRLYYAEILSPPTLPPHFNPRHLHRWFRRNSPFVGFPPGLDAAAWDGRVQRVPSGPQIGLRAVGHGVVEVLR